MVSAIIAAKAGAWVKSKLTLKNIAIIIGVLFVLWSLWKVYDWTIERGMTKQREIDEPKITALEIDRDKWKNKYGTYRESFKTWVYRSERARLNLAKQNEELINGLEQSLVEAKKRQKATRGLVHEIPQYVPATADVDLPVGFVRLYNISIEGESPASSSEQDRISKSVTLNVGAPSGVTLSTFAEYAVDNNAEAIYRGEIIRAWQEWYIKSKEQFDRAQQEAADSIPRVPDEAPTDPSTDTSSVNERENSHDAANVNRFGYSEPYVIRNPPTSRSNTSFSVL